ncbi:MAG: ATP-dependent 6-phosphofructokinase [Ruminococcaceae bacterium]|nr:ATP-dependent 6-phosphofructokinase [Oscillospiraceae bacterium]
MAKFRKIGILTSGGDAPGMNAAVRAVARKALDEGVEVVGIIGGYSGLINENIIPLTPRSVSNIISRGGTMLYTDRCLEFKTEEGMQKAIATCRAHEIDAIVALGGDGTFRGATDLTNRGIPSVGIPCTIDNDITATDYTIGFDSAMNTTMHMIDCLRDTCVSHARCNVVEVMGRDCGQIALYTALASGAVGAVVPEVPFDEKELIDRISTLARTGKRGFLVVVSEGVLTPDGQKYGEVLAKRIADGTGVETKFARLAHVVRGGSPTLRDRLTATKMGVAAVETLMEGKSNVVICEVDGKIVETDINYALIADRTYKNKLKPGDHDAFAPEQVAEMRALAERRRAEIVEAYDMLAHTSK